VRSLPTKLTKAQLVSRLKKEGIPIPKSAKIADMKHRLDYWQSGDGFYVRLLKIPSHSRWEGHPVQLLKNKKELYWIPRSEMAKEIIESNIVLILGNTSEPSNDAVIIDVPSDYRKVKQHGSNDSADS